MIPFYHHGKVNYEAYDPPTEPEPNGDFIWWDRRWQDRRTALSNSYGFAREIGERVTITTLLEAMITDTSLERYEP